MYESYPFLRTQMHFGIPTIIIFFKFLHKYSKSEKIACVVPCNNIVEFTNQQTVKKNIYIYRTVQK